MTDISIKELTNAQLLGVIECRTTSPILFYMGKDSFLVYPFLDPSGPQSTLVLPLKLIYSFINYTFFLNFCDFIGLHLALQVMMYYLIEDLSLVSITLLNNVGAL